jgi:hypothetical protein
MISTVLTRRNGLACSLVLIAILLALLSADSLAAASSSATHATQCRSLHERGGQTATHIATRHISCTLAREGIETYFGSPQGCLLSNACTQSGIREIRGAYVTCLRVQHDVVCEVVAPPGRGLVTFVEHPIGYAGLPGSMP